MASPIGPSTRRYARALERLYALQARGIRLGATRMRQALALRGHPERGQVFVHIGGTNGKGSVAAMVAACLRAAGVRTGLFTSPHLHRYVERVQIDGKPISEREAAQRIEALLEAFAGSPAPEATFFELTTLLAIEAFRDHKCEVVVLEVGLGGRLDATNAVPTAVSVITNVARDHAQVLGHTLREIATEKAGILRAGTPAVIGVRKASALRAIREHAAGRGVSLHCIGEAFEARLCEDGRIDVRAFDRVLPGVALALCGAHQLDNVACAVSALVLLERALGPERLVLSDAVLRRGLRSVRWPARLEHLPARGRKAAVLLDAAHNLDGARALTRYLEARAATPLSGHVARKPRGKRVLVFGALSDKDYRPMLAVLAGQVDEVVVCAPSIARAVKTDTLLRLVPGAIAAASVTAALTRAQALAGARGEVVVAGSIFLVAEARAHLLGLRSDPLIRM